MAGDKFGGPPKGTGDPPHKNDGKPVHNTGDPRLSSLSNAFSKKPSEVRFPNSSGPLTRNS